MDGHLRRKPTWHELWEAGWIEPPYCPWPRPTEASVLQELREAHRELSPRSWVMLLDDEENGILLAIKSREPDRLRHKVTKRWGHMWRLSKRELARKENMP